MRLIHIKEARGESGDGRSLNAKNGMIEMGVFRKFTRAAEQAEAMAALQHPNIVSVIDFGQTEDGCCFIVMELIDGTSLAERMRPNRLEVDQALEFAILTAPDRRDPALVAKLDAVAGRVLNNTP